MDKQTEKSIVMYFKDRGWVVSRSGRGKVCFTISGVNGYNKSNEDKWFDDYSHFLSDWGCDANGVEIKWYSYIGAAIFSNSKFVEDYASDNSLEFWGMQKYFEDKGWSASKQFGKLYLEAQFNIAEDRHIKVREMYEGIIAKYPNAIVRLIQTDYSVVGFSFENINYISTITDKDIICEILGCDEQDVKELTVSDDIINAQFKKSIKDNCSLYLDSLNFELLDKQNDKKKYKLIAFNVGLVGDMVEVSCLFKLRSSL